ncbi:MAG: hypothetical protein JNN24_01990 [Hyphomicrobium zavarzinii]|uniref:hypothetical protein n=1 Tax=Hyphomicrobium zavarzinii TaxID=48292 RepID=UPI001A5D52D5|nr:hypothetical protein [Hyphomicrobium zavarzinii]MBL8844518.1 hypothetical protein [Hyphomicrobium zavarzinii]
MRNIAGWRIQVSPQYCYDSLTPLQFFDVPVSDDSAAIAVIRNRPEASPGERVYAVRPLTPDELASRAGQGTSLKTSS